MVRRYGREGRAGVEGGCGGSGGGGELDVGEGREVERELIVGVKMEVRWLEEPLVGDVVELKVAGPLQKEGGGFAVEGEVFCVCEWGGGGGGGEDRVWETGPTEG